MIDIIFNRKNKIRRLEEKIKELEDWKEYWKKQYDDLENIKKDQDTDMSELLCTENTIGGLGSKCQYSFEVPGIYCGWTAPLYCTLKLDKAKCKNFKLKG